MSDDRAAWTDAAAMDLWWRVTGDDWPVPNDLPGRFLRAAARAETTTATDEDAADAWQWGGWSTITESAKRPEQAPRILGIANAVTDWIRAHADRTEKGDA